MSGDDEKVGNKTTPLVKSALPASREGFFSIAKTTGAETLQTAAAYDFSLLFVELQLYITHLGKGAAAPAITSMLSILGYLQFSAVMPTSNTLPGLLGELKKKEDLLDNKADHTQLNNEIIKLKKIISNTPKNGIAAGLVWTPAIIFVMVYADDVLLLFKQNENVTEPAENFFKAYAPFFTMIPLRLGMEFTLFSFNKRLAAMLIADSALLATIGLQYILTYQVPLDLKGLGLATGTGAVLTSVGFSAYVAIHFKDFKFLKSFLSWTREDVGQIWSLIKEQIPMIACAVGDVLANFATNNIAGTLPGNALVKQNVATAFLNFNMILIAAGAQTNAMRLGYQNGNKEPGHSLRLSTLAGITAVSSLQLPLMLFVSFFPSQFATLVGESVEESEMQKLMLLTVAYASLDSLRVNILSILRALGDNLKPSVASSLSLLLGVLGSYGLSVYTELGVTGLPIGLIAATSTSTLFLANRLIDRLYQCADIATNSDQQKDVKIEVKVDAPANDKKSESKKVDATLLRRQEFTAANNSSSWLSFFRCGRRRPHSEGAGQYKRLPEPPAPPDEKRKSICLVM